MVASMVIESAVLASAVVAAAVVVPIERLAVVPSPVAGMALPSPLLVQAFGIDKVAVSGFIELAVMPS